MTATVAQLGARALRHLGVAIVPNAQRPADGPTYTHAEVVKRVMRSLGMPYTEAERPALLGTVGQIEIAQRALRSLGVNPVADAPDMSGTVPLAEIAIRALRTIGVDPADITLDGTGRTIPYPQLATDALRKLGVVDAEETPSATDQAWAEQRVLDVHDHLWSLAYVNWPVTAVPGWVAEAYIAMTANLLAPSFGRAWSAETAQLAQETVRLQALNSGQVSLYRATGRVGTVHDALIAEGLGDWTLNAIPSTVADDYVALVAAEIAPIHGKAVDAAASVAARAHIRRIVLSGDRGLTLALDKVYAVHDQLVQGGVVAWPVSAVPIANTEDYVQLVAALLGPIYGAPGATEGLFASVFERMRRSAQIRDMEERTLEKVLAIHAEMNAMGIVSWGTDAIPGSVIDAYVMMATATAGATDGKPVDAGVMENAYQRVRQVAMSGPAGQALAEQGVRSVHASLAARGRARWTLANIPLYAEEPYVFMAAAMIAPEVGAKADPNWAMAAEMELIRIVSVPSSREPVRAVYF